MSEASINAYHKQLKTTETAQETEAAVLEKAAFALETAQRTPEDLEVFEKALQFNQLVWTSIQSVLDNDNQLPVEIVANLMSLSIFIDKQVAKALYSEDRDLLTSIITINRNIAAGLRDAARLAAQEAADAAVAQGPAPQTESAKEAAPQAPAPGSHSGFKPTDA